MLTSKDAQSLLTLVEQGQCAALALNASSVNAKESEKIHKDPRKSAINHWQALGLWHISQDQKTFIATQQLLALNQSLPSAEDAVAAMCAVLPEYQAAWAKIVAAQLKDAGGRNDINALAEQVSQLGLAAQTVLNQLDSASLSSSGYAEIEILLFGQGAEQAVSYLKVLRALSTGASLLAGKKQNLNAYVQLAEIEKKNTSSAWQAQRLIQMPTENAPMNFQLSGALLEFDDGVHDSTLGWLLACPWAYVLAHVAYAQDVWRSEQIAGGIRLEIEPSQAKHFMQPSLIQVVITTRDDLEIQCGTLGELLLRVLQTLNIHLFTQLPISQQAKQLDTLLAPFIGAMVSAKVWQFIQGSSKESPHYQIHPNFETLPNTRLGTINFARPGKQITAAIREQAEAWAIELSGRTHTANLAECP